MKTIKNTILALIAVLFIACDAVERYIPNSTEI